jgi:hypothetical protein
VKQSYLYSRIFIFHKEKHPLLALFFPSSNQSAQDKLPFGLGSLTS